MESLSMVSHTNALIKNRETIDINLYEQFIKYLDASPKTVETYKKSLKQMFSYLLSNNVTSPRCEDLLAYRNYLFAKGLKPTTIQNYITAAKIFFTWTNEEGYYPNIAEYFDIRSKTPGPTVNMAIMLSKNAIFPITIHICCLLLTTVTVKKECLIPSIITDSKI